MGKDTCDETHKNTVAIRELTIIATQTSKDIDKLVNKMDDIPEVRIVSLEKRLFKIEKHNVKVITSLVGLLLTVVGSLIYKYMM